MSSCADQDLPSSFVDELEQFVGGRVADFVAARAPSGSLGGGPAVCEQPAGGPARRRPVGVVDRRGGEAASSVAEPAHHCRRGADGARASRSVSQVRGERRRGRVVEDQGGRQAEPGGGGEPVAQLDGGQRVEAEVAEGAVRPRPPPGPSTAAVWSRTRSSSRCPRSASGRSASRVDRPGGLDLRDRSAPPRGPPGLRRAAGWARAAVKAGERAQSTSATATVMSPWSRPRREGVDSRPRHQRGEPVAPQVLLGRRRRRPMPPLTPRPPGDRAAGRGLCARRRRRARRGRRWPRRRRPARRCPRPRRSRRTARTRPGHGRRGSSCRCRAPPTFAATMPASSSGGRSRRAAPSSPTPAVCTTARQRQRVGVGPAEQPATSSRSATSQAADRDPGAERGQLRGQVGRAGGVGHRAAGQDQVTGAVLGEPAGHVPRRARRCRR